MKCPVCRATYQAPVANQETVGDLRQPTLGCRRCGADLSPLIRLHDQALWYHRLAIQSFRARDYLTATAQNNQALALHRGNADFHALAGQLLALQGAFQPAIASWKKALQLNPQQPTAGACLQYLMAFITPQEA